MLPIQKTPPRASLNDLTIFVYGPHKFGKSEWCSKAEGALFLATEAGLNSLDVFQLPIRTWDELLVAAKEIAEGRHSFRTVVLDTVDNAYRMCAEYICQRAKIEHESDLEYGKGYALINNEFHRVLNKLALLPYGLFFVSHSQEKEIETRTGKYTKVVPTLPDKARKLVLGMVDIILFGDLEPITGPDGMPAHRRVLRTKPSATYEAGDRTGRLPEVIDLDFAAFAAAFAQRGTAAATVPTTSTGSTARPPATDSPATSSAVTDPPATSSLAIDPPAASSPATSRPATPAPRSPTATSPRPTSLSPPTKTTSGATSSRPANTTSRSTTSPAKPRTSAATR